jgi:hypothetical protein
MRAWVFMAAALAEQGRICERRSVGVRGGGGNPTWPHGRRGRDPRPQPGSRLLLPVLLRRRSFATHSVKGTCACNFV